MALPGGSLWACARLYWGCVAGRWEGEGWAGVGWQPMSPWQSDTGEPEHREAEMGCCFFPLLPATETSILQGEGS